MVKKVRLVSLAMIAIMLMGVFSSCTAKPTAEDAQNYVQAVLDLICTGDYDHNVEFADVEAGKEGEIRDTLIEDFMNTVASEEGLSDEVKEGFRTFITSAFEKAKYTVGEATPNEDGSFSVSVTIEPLKAFDGADGFEKDVENEIMSDVDKYINMSEEELTNYAYKFILDKLNANLENPQYDEPIELTVQYVLIDEEENMYGIIESDGQKLGENLFSVTGL